MHAVCLASDALLASRHLCNCALGVFGTGVGGAKGFGHRKLNQPAAEQKKGKSKKAVMKKAASETVQTNKSTQNRS